MLKLHSVGVRGLFLALLVSSACGGGGDDGDKAGDPPRDAGPAPIMPGATGGAGADAAARDPFTDLITSVLGDGGLSGITNLLGDGGLAGLGGLFGDAGFSGFLDGGFDPSAVCARVPQFCPPDGGTTPRDGGLDAGTGGSDASTGDASTGDASQSDANVSANPDAGDAGDAGASADAGEADAGG